MNVLQRRFRSRRRTRLFIEDEDDFEGNNARLCAIGSESFREIG